MGGLLDMMSGSLGQWKGEYPILQKQIEKHLGKFIGFIYYSSQHGACRISSNRISQES